MATKKAPGEKKRMVVTLVDPNAVEPWVEDFLRRIQENDVNGVKSVVSVRRDAVGVHNATGEGPLIIASRLGHEALVNLLCEVVDDVDDSDDDGWTALLNACNHGHLGVARSLVQHGADVQLADLMGWTPLMWAVYKNHPEIVSFLLENDAHANLVDEEDGLTPLMAAAGRGFDQVVPILVAAGADVNATDKFGNTPLIWAARKGYLPIVKELLNAGVEIDTVGMHSSTALMLATRGNFLDVVELLISREPNLNVLDNNGCTALSIAAREGYGEIATALLEAGAYVNVVDKFGDPLIINAVRSGNVSIVRELLVKYADVNAKDLDGRTAMHLAIDKGYIDIVLTLLERKPNLEQRNKDGETALFRAVKSRNTVLTQLLVHSGAKVSATDKNGDNCLHLALRARSRHLTQTLLSRPNDARLLYRPNKLGETPYSIDQNNSEPILPFIFGPAESHAQPESMLGYDVYSNVLADILCEPNLSLPLTIGLYAKWGSGKSFLLNKMKASMQYFSRSWLETASLYWSWRIVFLLIVFGALAVLVLATITAAVGYAVHMIVTLVLGSLFIVGLLVFYVVIYYGSEIRGWQRCVTIANTLGRQLAHLRLFFNVIFFHPPILRDKDLLACPVAFLFADYHRLSSIGGEQALAKIVATLFEVCESHYGMLCTRLFCALKTSYARGSGSKLRRVCGVPVLMVAGISIGAIMLALVLLCVYVTRWNVNPNAAIGGSLYTALVLFITVLLIAAYPLGLVLVYGTSNAAKRRINQAARNLQTDRFEGFMQRLQQEVDLLADLVHCLDSFTQSQTRLVVVVDGLDNCEREKMVQTLDALELLFCSRQNRPFVVTIAVDPHIIISAVTHNMHSALTGTDLTGYDYLKNIVSMPFYLHNSALRQLQMNLRAQQKTLSQWKDRFARQETFHGSYISLNESDKKPPRKGTVSNAVAVGTSTVSNTLLTDDYFSNLNPRSMKRIVNTLTLTGRLMRAFEVDFSWLMLGHWVSLIEQWPYRMSWLIDYCDQVPDLPDHCSLADVYEEVKMRIPKLRSEDPLVDIDRNVHNFELYLKTASVAGAEQITVGHLRRFVPCTSNLDPYIRKLISERRVDSQDHTDISHALLNMVKTAPAGLVSLEMEALLPPPVEEQISGPARFLFKNPSVWSTIHVPLTEMSTEDVKQLVDQLDIPPERRDQYALQIQESNLSGLVLSICELSAVRGELKMTLGDWTMFKLLVETLRNFQPTPVSQILKRERGLSLTAQNSMDADRRHSWGPDSPRKLTAAKSPDPSELSSLLQRMGSRGQRSRTNAQSEVADEQRWLADQFGRMDTVEFAGDLGISSSARNSVCSSRAPSVRFDLEPNDANGIVSASEMAPDLARDLAAGQDETVRHRRNNLGEKLLDNEDNEDNEDASSDDSTESNFGSTGNLLGDATRKVSKLGAIATFYRSEPRLADPSLPEITVEDGLENRQPSRSSAVVKKRSQSEIKHSLETARTSRSPRFLRGQLNKFTADSVHSDTSVPLLQTACKSPDSIVADESSLSEEEHQLTTIKRQGDTVDGKPRVFEVFETKTKSDFSI